MTPPACLRPDWYDTRLYLLSKARHERRHREDAVPLKCCPSHGLTHTDAGYCPIPSCGKRLYAADPPPAPDYLREIRQEPDVESAEDRRARQAREQHDRL